MRNAGHCYCSVTLGCDVVESREMIGWKCADYEVDGIISITRPRWSQEIAEIQAVMSYIVKMHLVTEGNFWMLALTAHDKSSWKLYLVPANWSCPGKCPINKTLVLFICFPMYVHDLSFCYYEQLAAQLFERSTCFIPCVVKKEWCLNTNRHNYDWGIRFSPRYDILATSLHIETSVFLC